MNKRSFLLQIFGLMICLTSFFTPSHAFIPAAYHKKALITSVSLLGVGTLFAVLRRRHKKYIERRNVFVKQLQEAYYDNARKKSFEKKKKEILDALDFSFKGRVVREFERRIARSHPNNYLGLRREYYRTDEDDFWRWYFGYLSLREGFKLADLLLNAWFSKKGSSSAAANKKKPWFSTPAAKKGSSALTHAGKHGTVAESGKAVGN